MDDETALSGPVSFQFFIPFPSQRRSMLGMCSCTVDTEGRVSEEKGAYIGAKGRRLLSMTVCVFCACE